MDNLIRDAVDEITFEGEDERLWELLLAKHAQLKPDFLTNFKLQNLDEMTRDYITNCLIEKNDIEILYQDKPLKIGYMKTDTFDSECIVKAGTKLLASLYEEVDLLGFSEVTRKVYALIIKARDMGVVQTEFGAKLNIDAKTVFHHLKRLRKLGSIVSIPWLMSGVATKRFLHLRFAETSEPYLAYVKSQVDETAENFVIGERDGMYFSADVMVDRLDALLANAPNNILVKKDVITTFGLTTRPRTRAFNYILRTLVENGWIQIVKVKLHPAKKIDICIQALCRFSSQGLKDEPTTVVPYETKGSGLSMYSPIERQVYDAILESGTEGIGTVQLFQEFPWIAKKGLLRALEGLATNKKDALVTSVAKQVGKNRLMMYVAKKAKDLVVNPTPVQTINVNFDPGNVMSTSNQDQADAIPASGLAELCKFCHKTAALPGLSGLCSNECQRDFEDTEEWKKLSKGSKKKLYPSPNSVRRNRIILELVQQHGIVELNTAFMMDYKTRLFQHHPNSQSMISDVKSLKKTCATLHEEGKLQTFDTSISNPNGSQKLITIALRKDININSEQVTEFLKEVQHKILFVPRTGTQLAAITSNAPTLDIQVQRLGNAEEIDAAEEEHPVGTLFSKKDFRNTKYGYLTALNSRIKELHKYMFQQAMETEDRIVAPEALLPLIPIYIVVKVISLPETEEMTRFVSIPSNLNLTVFSAPEEIRKYFVTKTKVKNWMAEGIQKLADLGFVEALQYDDELGRYHLATGEDLAQYYRVKEQIDVMNYESNPPILHSSVQLTNFDSIDELWSQLENRCMSLVELQKTGYAPLKPQHRFEYLFRSHNWKWKFTFKVEHKAMLEKYIEKGTGCTPLKNNALCLTLARELDIPLSRVKYYFYRVEQIFQNRRKRKQPDAEGEEKTEKLSSIRKKRRIHQQEDQVENAEAPPVRRKQASEFRHRRKWSAEEDELILVAEAVISLNIENNRRHTSWFQVLIPSVDYNNDHYRRRVFTLKRNPDNARKLQLYKNAWEPFKQQSPEITFDDFTYLGNNFLQIVKDLKAFTEAREAEKITVPVELDFDLATLDLQQLNEKFILTSESDMKPSPLKLYQDLDRLSSRQAKLAHLGQVTFSRQIEYQSQAVELTTKRLQAMKAATLIKMLLITPKEKYDPSLGWNLLTTFDEAIIVAAIEELLQFETVIKISAVTKGNERKIPGRAYQLSSRFWEILGGPLSGKLGFQALQFWKSLLVGFEKEDQVKLPLLKLDGTMAVLMELLASPFYTISFDLDKVDEELHNTEPLYLKRIENGTLNRQNSFDIPEPNLDGDSERILASISSHSGLSVNQLKQCLDTIAEAKELGCAIQDLHRSLPGDTLFLQFEMALKQLVKAKMISRVGFDEIRYVSPEFVSAWQMNLPFENNELQYLPRLWTSPSGTKSDSIYRTCFDSVLSRIVVQPGVSKVSLINKDDLLAMVSVVFSRVDLEMILEDMIQKGTIEERIYQKQKCTSFVDGLFGSVTDQLIQPFDLFNAKISSFPQDLIHLYFPSESWFKSK